MQTITNQHMHADMEMSIYQSTEEYTKLPIKQIILFIARK